MVEHSEGIVLHSIKYSETSVISHIYTKKFGIHSFIMNNVRGNKSKMSFFQPLSILNIEFYNKKNSINRIKEVNFKKIHTEIYSSITTSAIALFISEFLYKLCNSIEKNEKFYDYLESFILHLEQNPNTNSHVLFLIQTTRFWGIFPQNNYNDSNIYFDIQSGDFSNISSETTTNALIGKLIHTLLKEPLFETSYGITRNERKELISTLLQYYSLHTHNLQLNETIQILETIFE